MEAALSLIAECGYDRTSLDAVAARAGVSKPTIYRRCPGGKADLVAQALRQGTAQRATPDTGSLRGDLLAFLRENADDLNENVHLAAGLVPLLRSSEEFAALFHEHVVAVGRARFTEIVSRAVARGEAPEGAPRTALFADVAPSLLHSRVLLTAEPVDDALLAELVDRVLLPILNPGRVKDPA